MNQLHIYNTFPSLFPLASPPLPPSPSHPPWRPQSTELISLCYAAASKVGPFDEEMGHLQPLCEVPGEIEQRLFSCCPGLGQLQQDFIYLDLPTDLACSFWCMEKLGLVVAPGAVLWCLLHENRQGKSPFCLAYSGWFAWSTMFVVEVLCYWNFSIFLKNKFIYLFVCFWLHWVFVAARGLSLVAASGGYSLLQCMGFSLQWLLLLWSMGSRCTGFSSCGSWALKPRLSSCGTRA